VGGVPVAPLVLEAVRPPVLHEWREELSLTAGEFKRLPFEMSAPACLTYWWRSAGHATTLSVVRLDGQPKARKSKSEPQTAILDLSGLQELDRTSPPLVPPVPVRTTHQRTTHHPCLFRRCAHHPWPAVVVIVIVWQAAPSAGTCCSRVGGGT
jgi:hypothetical protein